jgi:hypothetical protein
LQNTTTGTARDHVGAFIYGHLSRSIIDTRSIRVCIGARDYRAIGKSTSTSPVITNAPDAPSARRHVLPNDLANAIKQPDDLELDDW